MKLNLIPKTAAKGVASRGVFFLMLAIVLVSLVAAFLYNQKLTSDLASWKADCDAVKSSADEVVRAAAEADTIVAQARIVLTNTALYHAIEQSNKAYPDLYDEVKQYVPSFFRVRSMEARSTGATGCMVTIRGYLKTFQQYSDVMISFLRCKKVVAIGRGGFGPIPEGDEGPFAYSPETVARGPIPGWSAVSITLQMTNNLQSPDARRTLQAASSGAGGGDQGGQGGPGGRTGGPGGGQGGPRPGGSRTLPGAPPGGGS